MTTAQLRSEFQKIADQAFFAAYPLIGIAILISLLGLVNALVASLVDRIRQLGIMRAIGATRGQVTLCIVVEAAIVGLGGGIFGVLFGSLLGYLWVGQMPYLLGMTLTHRYPTGAVAFAFAATVVLACAAGYFPGRSASRINIMRALQYE